MKRYREEIEQDRRVEGLKALGPQFCLNHLGTCGLPWPCGSNILHVSQIRRTHETLRSDLAEEKPFGGGLSTLRKRPVLLILSLAY